MRKVDDNPNRVLAFRGYYFFNHTISPIYELVYCVNAFIGFLGCCTIAGVTSFSLVATTHAAAKFAFVQKNFENIERISWTKRSKKFGKAVSKHQNCIRYS